MGLHNYDRHIGTCLPVIQVFINNIIQVFINIIIIIIIIIIVIIIYLFSLHGWFWFV